MASWRGCPLGERNAGWVGNPRSVMWMRLKQQKAAGFNLTVDAATGKKRVIKNEREKILKPGS